MSRCTPVDCMNLFTSAKFLPYSRARTRHFVRRSCMDTLVPRWMWCLIEHNAPPGGVLCDAGYTQSSKARRAHIGAAAGVMGRTAQLLLDTHELVVFFHSLAARGGAGLEMAGIERHGEIRNETVHGLA